MTRVMSCTYLPAMSTAYHSSSQVSRVRIALCHRELFHAKWGESAGDQFPEYGLGHTAPPRTGQLCRARNDRRQTGPWDSLGKVKL